MLSMFTSSYNKSKETGFPKILRIIWNSMGNKYLFHS